jgi:hypothetical protein
MQLIGWAARPLARTGGRLACRKSAVLRSRAADRERGRFRTYL